MKLAAAAAAVLALTLLSMSSPPAVAVRTSSSAMGAPRRRRHLQPPAVDVDVTAVFQAQLAQLCPPDSFACPGTYFAVLRNPAQRCKFYPCPPPVGVDNASTNGAAANGENGIAAEEKATSTDSRDVTDQLLADMATLGALANSMESMEEDGQEADGQEGEGGPDAAAAATSDVEVLAVEGDGQNLPPYELPAPPVQVDNGAGGGNPTGLADELAAFDEALSATAASTGTAPPTATAAAAANCTPCTNTPTQNMLQRSYDCATAIQALAVQCHEDGGWTAGNICEYSCYKAGRGYDRTDVLMGGTRCCEVGEVPRAKEEEQVLVEQVVVEVAAPTVVQTPDGVDGVGGVDPAEVAREGGGDGEGDEEPPAGEVDPAESTESAAGTVGTNTVDTNEDEEEAGDETAAEPNDAEATEEATEEEESMAMEEATEEEMVEAGDAPPQSPAEAGADTSTTAAGVNVEIEVEDEADEGEGDAKPGMEVEIISESIAVVDTAPDTTTDDEEDEEDAEEAANTDIGATDQDEGAVDETLLEGDDETPAAVTAEEAAATDQDEQVESAAATPPPEEATTVTTEEVISEEGDDMDEAMDQPTSNVEDVPTEQTAVDEPTSPSTAEDVSTTAGEMTTPGADKNFDETTDPMCGVDAGDALCPFAEDGTAVYCCSEWGFCGQGVEWCGDGCQEGYGLCGSAETTDAEVEAEVEGEVETATNTDMASDTDEESTAMDEMMPTNTNTTEPSDEDVEDESTGTAEEITEEVILPEEPTDMEDPTDAMEEPTDAMDEPIAEEPIAEEQPPMDQTSDIVDTEGNMDEAAATTSEDPIAEVEDLIPGDAVTEISREDGGTTTETSMDDVEGEEATGLRGSSVAAVQTATSSAAGVKVMASIMIAGASTVVFGMM